MAASSAAIGSARDKLHADVAIVASRADGAQDGRVVQFLAVVRLMPTRVAGNVIVSDLS